MGRVFCQVLSVTVRRDGYSVLLLIRTIERRRAVLVDEGVHDHQRRC